MTATNLVCQVCCVVWGPSCPLGRVKVIYTDRLWVSSCTYDLAFYTAASNTQFTSLLTLLHIFSCREFCQFHHTYFTPPRSQIFILSYRKFYSHSITKFATVLSLVLLVSNRLCRAPSCYLNKLPMLSKHNVPTTHLEPGLIAESW